MWREATPFPPIDVVSGHFFRAIAFQIAHALSEAFPDLNQRLSFLDVTYHGVLQGKSGDELGNSFSAKPHPPNCPYSRHCMIETIHAYQDHPRTTALDGKLMRNSVRTGAVNVKLENNANVFISSMNPLPL